MWVLFLMGPGGGGVIWQFQLQKMGEPTFFGQVRALHFRVSNASFRICAATPENLMAFRPQPNNATAILLCLGKPSGALVPSFFGFKVPF